MELVENLKVSHNKVKEKELANAHYVLEQAEKKQVCLIYGPDEYRKVCRSLASLGEDGRDILQRLAAISGSADGTRTVAAVHKDFDAALLSPYKTAVVFFAVAKEYGLATKPATLRESKERITARDFLGSFASEWLQYGLWQEDGAYWSADAKYQKYELTNFTMNFLFFMKKSKDASFRLITVKNVHGLSATLFVNTDEMISVGSFKRILEREGPFLFKGSDADLGRLKDKLQHDEKGTTIVTRLGWNKDGFYAFANGIFDPVSDKFIPVDEFGTVEFNARDHAGNFKLKYYFIPANSKIYSDIDTAYEAEKKFVYRPLTFSFETWAAQFATVYAKQGQMIMVFYMMALFSDIIFKNTLRRFPIFNVYGMPFSGKGTMIESVMRLFGDPQDQVMLEGSSTDKGAMRALSQLCNAMAWFDEYKNSLGGKIIGSIKNVYDRKGYIRAKKDNTYETEISQILSALILSGQEMPSLNPALFSRVILTIKVGTSFTPQQRENYRVLEEMENAGVSGITTYLLKYRDYFEQNFRAFFDLEYKRLALDINNNEVGARQLSNYASMIATFELLAAKVALPFTLDAFRDNCKSCLMEQFYIMKGSDDLAKFWDVVQLLFNSGEIKENVDFKLANGFLYLRVEDVFQRYTNAMTARKDPTALDKETLKKYLESVTQTFVQRCRVWIGGIQCRVFQFNYEPLDIDLIRADTKEELRRRREAMKLNTDDIDDGEMEEMRDE